MEDTELRRLFNRQAEEIKALTAGCTALAGAIGTQTLMLAQILEAVTTDAEPSPLAETLEQIFNALNRQTDSLVELNESMANVGPGIEAAVIRGLNRAVGRPTDPTPNGN